jgi:cysteine desulfurase
MTFEQARPIYLDYQSTTPVDQRVMDAMIPFFTRSFGNPHSTSHAYGWKARDAVEAAREQVAKMINAEPREVIFTSGATESNNMAIKGVGRFFAGRKNHMIALKTEHKCVLESLKYMQRHDIDVTWLDVNSEGLVDLDEFAAAIRPDTALASVMLANNEIGVIQPLADIGALCREHGVYLHSDAAQAAGKLPIDVQAMNIDLMSLSGHKMYGPMGIGALYVRRKPRVRFEPLMDGGGQERTMRSGTIPAPLVVGFGKAAQIITEELGEETLRVKDMRDRLLKGLQQRIADMFLNGSDSERIAGNINIGFRGGDSKSLMETLKDHVALSSGSACTSTSVEPSYVLRAIGLSDQDAHSSIRMCVGRMTTADEIEKSITAISDAVCELRNSDEAKSATSVAV